MQLLAPAEGTSREVYISTTDLQEIIAANVELGVVRIPEETCLTVERRTGMALSDLPPTEEPPESGPRSLQLSPLPSDELPIESQEVRLIFAPRNTTSRFPKGSRPYDQELKTESGKWLLAQESLLGLPRPYLFVAQMSTQVSCKVLEPIKCEIYFDNQGSSVEILNRSDKTFHIQGKAYNEEAVDVDIRPGYLKCIQPGSYVFEGRDHKTLFSLTVLRRPEYLERVLFSNIRPIVGQKRPFSDEYTASDNSALSHRDVVHRDVVHRAQRLAATRKLHDIAKLGFGHEGRVGHSGVCDYKLYLSATTWESDRTTVFRGRMSDYDEEIAIKVLKPGKHGSVRLLAERWNRETYDLGYTSERTITPIGADSRFMAVFFKFKDANDLTQASWCNSRTHVFSGDDDDAERVLYDISRELVKFADSQLVHNDVRPSNILLDRTNGAYLLDCSLYSHDTKACHTGTPWYMPPELPMSQHGHPRDVWAFAIVMLYLLRVIRLPELDETAGLWTPSDIGLGGEPEQTVAMEAMWDWLEKVENCRKKLPQTGIRGIVRRMLDPDSRTRMTMRVVVEHTEAWKHRWYQID